MVVLANLGDDSGQRIYPSKRFLADMLRCSERNVILLLRRLEQAGEIEKTRAGGHGQHSTTHYRIPLPQPDAVPADEPTPILKAAARRVPVKRSGYTAEFEEAWKSYPEREGGNSKVAAWRAWCARLREKVTPADMIAGIGRYAAYARAENMLGGRYVKMAATFLGPDRFWEEPWALKNGHVGAPKYQSADDYFAGAK